jgi:hypothetical protein
MLEVLCLHADCRQWVGKKVKRYAVQAKGRANRIRLAAAYWLELYLYSLGVDMVEKSVMAEWAVVILCVVLCPIGNRDNKIRD